MGNPSGRPVQNAPFLHKTAELLDADFFTVKSIPELK
jgi:hypothetical protein